MCRKKGEQTGYCWDDYGRVPEWLLIILVVIALFSLGCGAAALTIWLMI